MYIEQVKLPVINDWITISECVTCCIRWQKLDKNILHGKVDKKIF